MKFLNYFSKVIFIWACGLFAIVGGVSAASGNEIIIEHAQNAKEAATRFHRNLLSLDPNSIITICLSSTCEEITEEADNFVKYFVRIKENYIETRIETSAVKIEDESLFLPHAYTPVTKFPPKNSISSAEKIIHLSALIQTRPQLNNNDLYKLLGDTSFEFSDCSYADFDTLEIIVFSELIAKECRSGLLNQSLYAYFAADVCNNSLDCLPVMTRISVLLSYVSPGESIDAFQNLQNNIQYLENLGDKVMVKKKSYGIEYNRRRLRSFVS